MITNAAGGIITKGLGRPACAGMIVNYFSLTLAVDITPPEPPLIGGGGGPYPGPAWNVLSPGTSRNFYKPYSPEYQQYYLMPNAKKTRFITIRIKFKDREIERAYEVTERQADTAITIVNGVTTLQQRIRVSVSNLKKMAPTITNFKRLASRISVKINSVKHKD